MVRRGGRGEAGGGNDDSGAMQGNKAASLERLRSRFVQIGLTCRRFCDSVGK